MRRLRLGRVRRFGRVVDERIDGREHVDRSVGNIDRIDVELDIDGEHWHRR